jgi:hypothetical protein
MVLNRNPLPGVAHVVIDSTNKVTTNVIFLFIAVSSLLDLFEHLEMRGEPVYFSEFQDAEVLLRSFM